MNENKILGEALANFNKQNNISSNTSIEVSPPTPSLPNASTASIIQSNVSSSHSHNILSSTSNVEQKITIEVSESTPSTHNTTYVAPH